MGISSNAFATLHKEFVLLDAARQKELSHPWVAVVAKRMEVAGYIGFRHVTGIKPWAALEKAGYIATSSKMAWRRTKSPVS